MESLSECRHFKGGFHDRDIHCLLVPRAAVHSVEQFDEGLEVTVIIDKTRVVNVITRASTSSGLGVNLGYSVIVWLKEREETWVVFPAEGRGSDAMYRHGDPSVNMIKMMTCMGYTYLSHPLIFMPSGDVTPLLLQQAAEREKDRRRELYYELVQQEYSDRDD